MHAGRRASAILPHVWRWVAIVAMAFASATAVPVARAQSETYDAVIAQAVEAFESERYVEARRLFVEAHALLPSPRTRRGIGMCALELGDYAGAYHELSAALDMPPGDNPLTPALRTQVEQMRARARAHVGIYAGLPAGATLRVGESAVDPEPDGTVALAEGERVVGVRLADGREQPLTLMVVGGATEALPPLTEATTPGTSGTTDGASRADALGSPEATPSSADGGDSHVVVVEDDQRTAEPAPHERTLALELALSLRGGSRNSGRVTGLGMSGAFGPALSGALLARLEPGLWLGGALTLAYDVVTEADTSSFTAMEANSARTRGWFEGDLDLVLHLAVAGTPLVIAAGIGPAIVYRDETRIDPISFVRTSSSSSAFGASLTASVRISFADDRLFVGVEAHGMASAQPAAELGLVLGGAPL